MKAAAAAVVDWSDSDGSSAPTNGSGRDSGHRLAANDVTIYRIPTRDHLVTTDITAVWQTALSQQQLLAGACLS